jgi:murein DD-endopeptidase MepM/ murein hydrolase activator NlpD
MKIRITENQLKKIVESTDKKNLDEGIIDFVKGAYDTIKKLIDKFKNGDITKTDFETELKKLKGKKSEETEIPKGKGYNFNSSNGFKSKSRPNHQGVDYQASGGDKIVLKKGGEVKRTQSGCSVGNHKCGGGFGNHVWVKHDDGTETIYAHFTDTLVEKGDKVLPGTLIGTVGNTGHSFGDHLHFELIKSGKKVDGSSDSSKYFVILDKSSDYKGK